MSEDQKTEGRELAPVRQRAVVENVQPLFDTAKFEHFQRAATALMNSTLLPPSVRGDSPAQCFSNLILVFEVADRWNMPATALAQCVSVVHGKLMYEGKVVTAMLESTMATRLQYHWTGERGTPGYRIFVWDKSFDPKDGFITQEQLDALGPDRYPPGARMIDGCVGDWQTFQKDNRTPNPAWQGAASRNQLAYRGSREWARLYEPGRMLGVYGDDEIVAWETARVVKDEAAQPTGVSVGFSRPAPVVDKPEDVAAADAEFSDVSEGGPAASTVTVEEVSPQQVAEALRQGGLKVDVVEPQEGPGPAETAAGPDAPATGQDAATAQQGQDLEASEPKAGRKAAAPKVEAAPAEDGGHHGLAADAFEAGHVSGLAGEPGTVPHAWSNFSDEYAEGWNAGAAERLADADDDDAEMDDDGPEGEGQTRDEFDTFLEAVRNLATWGDVKHDMNLLSRSDAWKASTPEALTRRRQARISAGLRLSELQASGKEALDIQATDLTAFRCWIETVEDPDMILAKWQDLILSPAFQALEPSPRAAMEKAARGRMDELRQPRLDV